MGISGKTVENMMSGSHFVIAKPGTRKTCFVKLSRDNMSLVISGHGCMLPQKQKIKIEDILELQMGHQANYWKEESKAKLPEERLCFSIIMEKASKKNKNLIAITETDRDEWFNGLTSLCNFAEKLNPEQQQYYWIWKMFKESDKNNDGRMNSQEVLKLFNKLGMEISEGYKTHFKALILKYDESNDGYLSFSEIVRYFKDKACRPDIESIFNKHSRDGQIIRPHELLNFLKHTQHEAGITMDVSKQLIIRYEGADSDNDDYDDDCVMSLRGFTNMLLSYDWGSPFCREDSQEVHMDMSRPLSHYFIASSHNTYLSAGQLIGESNISNYQRAIEQGCRCVELDCWNGDDGIPIVYHGHTLTSTIKFVHVIETIRDYAFLKTSMPMMLSLENHCNVEQQDKMIGIMKELLGKKLLIEALSEDETDLPSPQDLRNKVILKGKCLSKVNKGKRAKVSLKLFLKMTPTFTTPPSVHCCEISTLVPATMTTPLFC